MNLSLLLKYQTLALIFIIIAVTKVGCFYFNFPNFQEKDKANLLLSENSKIYLHAIQITPDVRDDESIRSSKYYSGRAFYKNPFTLWNKNKTIASFNTTFVLFISPETSPGGEGIAFILTSDTNLPENSDGQWLGIVNGSTDGDSRAQILAVEFDT